MAKKEFTDFIHQGKTVYIKVNKKKYLVNTNALVALRISEKQETDGITESELIEVILNETLLEKDREHMYKTLTPENLQSLALDLIIIVFGLDPKTFHDQLKSEKGQEAVKKLSQVMTQLEKTDT